MLKNAMLPRRLSISRSVKINCSETTIQARWRIIEKCPAIFVKSFCLSVRPHVSARLLAIGFPWNLMRADLYENLSGKKKTSNLVTVGQKYREFYMKTWIRFIVAGYINSP